MHCAVGLAHPQLDRPVRLAVLGRDRARRRVHLVGFASRHLRRLEAVDRLDLGVRIDDPAGGVLEHHSHGRVAKDRVHHPALAVESVHQLQLAKQDGGLAGQHAGESSRLRAARGDAGDEETRKPAFDLDRDRERVGRRPKEVKERPEASRSGRRGERTKQLSTVGDRHPG